MPTVSVRNEIMLSRCRGIDRMNQDERHQQAVKEWFRWLVLSPPIAGVAFGLITSWLGLTDRIWGGILIAIIWGIIVFHNAPTKQG